MQEGRAAPPREKQAAERHLMKCDKKLMHSPTLGMGKAVQTRGGNVNTTSHGKAQGRSHPGASSASSSVGGQWPVGLHQQEHRQDSEEGVSSPLVSTCGTTCWRA